jgi:hypothetical protein
MVQKFFKTLAVSALVAGSAFASAQAVNNGSFELPTVNDGVTTNDLSASGWTPSPSNNNSSIGIVNPDANSFLTTTQQGDNYLQLRASSTTVSQTITGLDTAQWGYRLTYFTNGGGGIASLTNALAAFTGPSIDTSFLAGGGAQSFAVNSDADSLWQRHFLDFRASSSSVTLSFAGDGNTGSGYSYIDNVTISAIPEPESYAMLLAGLGAIGFMSRRRRTNQG